MLALGRTLFRIRRFSNGDINGLAMHLQFLHRRCMSEVSAGLNCHDFNGSKTTLRRTIFALSSGQGKAGIAVIRVSGPDTPQVFYKVTKLKKPPEPRKTVLTSILDPESGEKLDKGILLWFKAPASFTGEDSCELHIHGGPAIIAAVLTALSKLPGFRPSEPGEFTKRAFFNGKLDLTAVEGLADLIQAETEAQRKQALRQMDGELHRIYRAWRQRIIKTIAHVEAYIDFSEDENIEDGVLDKVEKEVEILLQEIQNHLADNRRGERLRNGVHVVIVGSPNVGKSSLLNHISQRPSAIVSPIAGTTRDVVECAVNIGGYPVLISDTAGLHESVDTIEQEGIRRALARARNADLLILMLDALFVQKHYDEAGNVFKLLQMALNSLGLEEVLKKYLLNNYQENDSIPFINDGPAKIMVVANKIDLTNSQLPSYIKSQNKELTLVGISCVTGYGLLQFMEEFKLHIESLCANPTSENPSLTQARHRTHLTNCVANLQTYLVQQKSDIVLAAYELQKGAKEIGKISGEITSEQILDVIFQDFCIGK